MLLLLFTNNSKILKRIALLTKLNYFLSFSRVVAGICYWPWTRCSLAEYSLALSKYEGYLASKFPEKLITYLCKNSRETEEVISCNPSRPPFDVYLQDTSLKFK